MKLWRISQTKNSDYDTYDSAIVAAETEAEARLIQPDGDYDEWSKNPLYSSWVCTPEDVLVQCIGEASPGTTRGVILASFNAG